MIQNPTTNKGIRDSSFFLFRVRYPIIKRLKAKNNNHAAKKNTWQHDYYFEAIHFSDLLKWSSCEGSMPETRRI